MDQVNQYVKEIFNNIEKLKEIEPSYTWGNFLGDYGEYIGIKAFNLVKSPNTMKGYDALNQNGKTVQIKTIKTGTDIKFKNESVDLLLVIKVESTAEWQVLYYGDFDEVKKFSTYSKYSNRYVVNLSKIKSLNMGK